MKHTPLVVALLLALGSAAQPQTRYTYFFFKPIYTFTANATKLSENSVSVDNVTYTHGTYGSYGKGLCLQLGVGKMINNTLGFELGAEWVHGKKLTSTYMSDSNKVEGESKAKVNALLFKPVLVLRNSGDLLAFYSKFGVVISAYSKLYSEGYVRQTVKGADLYSIFSSVDNIKVKVGFTAAFGASIRVSPAISLTVEVNGQMIALPMKNGHYTEFTTNGRDLLPNLTPSQKSWVYEKSVSSQPGNLQEPQKRLYEPINFSYVT